MAVSESDSFSIIDIDSKSKKKLAKRILPWSKKRAKATTAEVQTFPSAIPARGDSEKRTSVFIVAKDFELEVECHEHTGGGKTQKWVSLWSQKLSSKKKRSSPPPKEIHQKQAEPRILTLAEQLQEAQSESFDTSQFKVLSS